MNSLSEHILLKWKWLVGIPREFWMVHEKYVSTFIEKYNLKPVSKQMLAPVHKEMVAEAAINIEDIIGRYGGNRGPHLHYRGNMYLLNSDQWRQFSAPILKDFSKKLAEAATVNFEQFIELADTMNAMP